MIDQLLYYARQYQAEVLLVQAAVTVLLFICLAVALVSLRRMRTRYAELLTAPSGENLEDTLKQYLQYAVDAKQRAEFADERLGELVQQVKGCLQRSGLVRFDAFDNVSGKQSFSLALLDAQGDGVVLTTLYGRDSCRVYGKQVCSGRADSLTQEEQQAIEEALRVETAHKG
ncbi:MAG: DUF4446 family protein [Armatimonadota bacterium]